MWTLGATPQPVSARLPWLEREAIVALANPRLVVGGEPGSPARALSWRRGSRPTRRCPMRRYRSARPGTGKRRPRVAARGAPSSLWPRPRRVRSRTGALSPPAEPDATRGWPALPQCGLCQFDAGPLSGQPPRGPAAFRRAAHLRVPGALPHRFSGAGADDDAAHLAPGEAVRTPCDPSVLA